MPSIPDAAIRPPAVAGMFYPASAAELGADIDRMLDGASAQHGPSPKAIIVPHAGYIYSGPIAAEAYALLRPIRGRIERVVLLGPAHRVAFRGFALPSVKAFRTPLGDIPIDRPALDRLRGLPEIKILDEAHAGEHSLEVHLPFLQRTLGSFALLPIVVGMADGDDVAKLLDAIWGGPETLIVISSDLSHYYDHARAQKLDLRTAGAIERLDGAALDEESACGRVPIRGLLQAAKRRGLACRRLDLRNSGDTAGPRDQVVGYGAWALSAVA
ncbi:MAG: AmmeMemoRadiSam system protein B [Alphaproteobacteria bacterium]|nr:AmmeMemoRadiSam system protein B [Alphaproteobacteria bacterium]